MTHVNQKRDDKWGCFYDREVELIDEARYEAHLSEHTQYPQSWCVWCEEEKEQKDHE